MASLRSLTLIGDIGGVVGTAAMTAAMRQLHRLLPDDERYPLPPREITQRVFPASSSAATANRTIVSHFGFGALAGALLAGAGRTRAAALGPAVWAASYLGWIPVTGILRRATTHPWRRNALMAGVHVVWGLVTVATTKDLLAARGSIFGSGEMRDAQ